MNIAPAKKWRVLDTLILVLFVGGVGWFVNTSLSALKYTWYWAGPLDYIVGENEAGMLVTGLLAEGLATSLRLFLYGSVLALVVGSVIAAAALSKDPVLRWVARLYVEGLRHMPPLVFMFVFFFFISTQLFTTDIWQILMRQMDGTVTQFLFGSTKQTESIIGGVLCLALFEAAFFAEIIRAGVLSIERGQWDASRSLGFFKWRTLRLVILPQVVARIAAPLTGQLILLIKDSAILSIISVQELTFTAHETAISTQQVFETWLLAAGLYFVLCWPLLLLSQKFEAR